MNGVNISEIQNLLGHKHVETTMIYTHVIRDLVNIPKSPLDALYANSPLDNVKVAPYLPMRKIKKTNTNAIDLLSLLKSRFRNKFGMTHFFLSCFYVEHLI
jgi:hypothetical protein